MTSFHIQICSQWRVTCDGSEIYIPAQKSRALLSYLVMERSLRHDREHLAGLLWGQADTKLARASLRQTLLNLRKLFEPLSNNLLLVTRQEVELNQNLIETDIDWIATGSESLPLDDSFDRRVAALRRILPGFDDLGDEFETWLSVKRATMRTRALQRLSSVYLDENEAPTKRLKFAQAAYALDDLEEPAVRTMMNMHACLNNVSAALKLYGEFYKRMETEMDVAPSLQTQDLAVEIKLQLERNQPNKEQSTALAVSAKPASSGIPGPEQVTVVVMPFEELGPGVFPDYLKLGLMDQITCELASYPAPAVISSNTSRNYINGFPALSDIYRDLKARYAVTGNLRGSFDAALVSVQLVDTVTERVVWAKLHRCSREEVFCVNTTIAENIVRAVVPSLQVAELNRTRSADLDELEPFHCVIRAKELIFELTEGSLQQAGQLLQKAIQIQPYYSPAHTLLADWYSLRIWQGWSTDPTRDQRALEGHAKTAIRLSPDNGRAMALLGHNRAIFEREYDEGLALFEAAIERWPNDAETLLWTVPTLSYTENADPAVRNAEKALELSPLDPFRFRYEHFLSLAHYAAGNYDESITFGQASFNGSPNYSANLRVTLAAMAAAGRVSEADSFVKHHQSIAPAFSVTDFIQRQGFRNEGDRRKFGRELVAAGLRE